MLDDGEGHALGGVVVTLRMGEESAERTEGLKGSV